MRKNRQQPPQPPPPPEAYEPEHRHPWAGRITIGMTHPCCGDMPIVMDAGRVFDSLSEEVEDVYARAAADLVRAAARARQQAQQRLDDMDRSGHV